MSHLPCAACGLVLKPTQKACRCGYSTADTAYIRPASNEIYFLDRRFGPKKREAMVLHALMYALRDVNMLFQHPVPVNQDGSTRYLIDAFLPDFEIAVEVDEEYHTSEEQVALDQSRQAFIEEKLGCTFRRINAHSRPIFEQIDQLAAEIRALARERSIAAWLPPSHDENQGIRSGAFTLEHREALEAAGAFSDMEELANHMSALGIEARLGKHDGIPSPSNGEAGFIFSIGPVAMMIYRRAASDAIRLRVAGYPAAANHPDGITLLNRLGFGPLEARQTDSVGRGRYYVFPNLPDQHPREQVLAFLAALAPRIRQGV